jgi:hypothetical protein
VVLVLVGVLLVGACRGGEDGASQSSASRPSVSQPSVAPTTEPSAEQVVILTSVTIAPTPGAEPVATGEVLEGSTLGGSPFCVGGTILDSHASTDPAMEPYGLLARTITCSDGTLRVGFTPEEPPGLKQMGSWTIVSGTGAFEGLRGSGEMDVTYNPDDHAMARETYTGTVTR